MLFMDLIELVQTKWTLTIVFVCNIDGTIRLCVECRNLNAMKNQDSYLISRMEE